MGKDIERNKSEKIYVPKPKNLILSELLMTILGKVLIDKKEYNYPEAEKKLELIIRLTDKKRLETELRFLRAKALFEMAHLRMNEGLVSGMHGSISYYGMAREMWKGLKDNPNLIYTLQQIGVSHYIQGNPSKSKEIYESILGEVPKKKLYLGIKANILRDLSNAYIALGEIRKADENVEKSLHYAEDVGDTCLFYTRLQKAKLLFRKRRYPNAEKLIMESLKDRPRYRVLDYMKARILLFDLYMASKQKGDALSLAPYIQENCETHLFSHQLQKFNNLLSKYHVI